MTPWRSSVILFVCAFVVANAKGEAPSQPVGNVADLPSELRSLPVLAVLHQWSPLDRPWKTVSHATFPVGRAKLVDGDTRVLAYNPKTKAVTPAQIDVVVRDGAGAPEVVEAIFTDELERGSNLRCLFLKAVAPAAASNNEGWTLIADKDAVVARMTDGLGVKYRGSLFEHRIVAQKSGPLEFVEEFFGRLTAEDQAASHIPQPFRFHTFVTARKGEPSFDVRVIVENCPSENPAAEFPFHALELGVKDRALIWEDSLLPMPRRRVPENGWIWHAAIPANKDGTLHVAPDHFLMRLRFALSTPANKDRAGVRMQHEPLYVAVPGLDASNMPTASWHSVAAFGPTRVGIPRGDGPHAAIRDRVDREVESWRTENPLLKHLGPFWVYGEVGGEAPSGVEIAFTCPWAGRFIQSGGAPSPWKLINAAFDANLARQHFGFWKADGSLWTLDDVLETKNGVACTPELNIHSGKPHPTPWCRKFSRNERHAEANYLALKAAMDQPGRVAAYVKELDQYTNHDGEHLCRFTQYLFPLVWLGNDPAAKAILEVQASMAMAGANPFPTGPNGEAASGSLAELHRIAAEKPHWGSPHLARGLGWVTQAAVGGLAVTRNSSLQRLGRKWLSDFAQLPEACQLPTGGVHRTDGDQTATFDLDGDGRISKDESNMPVEHGSIYMQGIFRFAGCRSVLMQLDPQHHAAEKASLERAARALDRYFIDFGWDDDADLPGWNAVVLVKSKPNAIVSTKRHGTVWGGSPDAAFYFDDVLAEAYRISGDEHFLEKLAALHAGELKAERDSGNSIHAAWAIDASPSRRSKKR